MKRFLSLTVKVTHSSKKSPNFTVLKLGSLSTWQSKMNCTL